MIHAPTLSDVLKHRTVGQRALCGVLFAPPFSEVALKVLIPRFGYLHDRSGQDIHFYCAGFGRYDSDRPADAVSLREFRKTSGDHPDLQEWWFSEVEFAGFVRELQQKSKWKYEGETELLLFNPTIDFRDVLSLKIVRMVADKAIDNASALFEDILRYSMPDPQTALQRSTAEISDDHLGKTIWKGLVGAISSGPSGAVRAFEYGRHFATHNIHKDASP